MYIYCLYIFWNCNDHIYIWFKFPATVNTVIPPDVKAMNFPGLQIILVCDCRESEKELFPMTTPLDWTLVGFR